MIKVIFRSILAPKNDFPHRAMVRNFSFYSLVRSSRKYLSLKAPKKPPYHHVCQIGDPSLRLQAEPVDPEIITTPEFKKFVDHLIGVMRKYGAFGLAAPQIGTSAQVFVVETSEKAYEDYLETKSGGQPIEIVPLHVFINPRMKIIDYSTYNYPESCASVYGYSAHVPRAKSISIEAIDLSGKPFVWKAHGWPARVAQHEMDHLRGKIYTDKMDPKTLSCVLWDAVNRKGGKIGMDFIPGNRSKFRNFFYV